MTLPSLRILDDVCTLIVDCEHKTAPIQNTGYPSIRTPNIGRGRFLLEGVNRVSKDTYRDWTKRAVPQENDLILAREAPVGNVAILTTGLKVCLGQRTVLIRPDKSKVNPHYLVYVLLGDEIQGKFHSYSGGATVAHLNMKDIRNLKLPKIPPLETQQKIGSILSAYDNLIENNTRRIKILEEMARMIYREWFVNFRFPGYGQVKMVDSPLGKIPEGWEVGKLQDYIELCYGKALKAEDRKEGPYPVYGSSGVVGFHSENLVASPGVIVGRKGNVGSIRWTDEPFFPIDTVYSVKTDVSLYYVFYNLQQQNFINNDAAVPGLNRNQAYSLPFILPFEPLLRAFDEFIGPVFKEVHSFTKKNQNLRQTRDLLLPKLISGEVAV